MKIKAKEMQDICNVYEKHMERKNDSDDLGVGSKQILLNELRGMCDKAHSFFNGEGEMNLVDINQYPFSMLWDGPEEILALLESDAYAGRVSSIRKEEMPLLAKDVAKKVDVERIKDGCCRVVDQIMQQAIEEALDALPTQHILDTIESQLMLSGIETIDSNSSELTAVDEHGRKFKIRVTPF